MLRGRTRRDANEAAILDSFKRAGWAVLKINEPGAPDAVVFKHFHYEGWRCFLVEVKVPKGKLRPKQVKFHSEWSGPEIRIVRTIEDVIEMVR
jgi:hypothetical protein